MPTFVIVGVLDGSINLIVFISYYAGPELGLLPATHQGGRQEQLWSGPAARAAAEQGRQGVGQALELGAD